MAATFFVPNDVLWSCNHSGTSNHPFWKDHRKKKW